ncbi:hypothetical protein D3C81_2142920 [compost metagenome]
MFEDVLDEGLNQELRDRDSRRGRINIRHTEDLVGIPNLLHAHVVVHMVHLFLQRHQDKSALKHIS